VTWNWDVTKQELKCIRCGYSPPLGGSFIITLIQLCKTIRETFDNKDITRYYHEQLTSVIDGIIALPLTISERRQTLLRWCIEDHLPLILIVTSGSHATKFDYQDLIIRYTIQQFVERLPFDLCSISTPTHPSLWHRMVFLSGAFVETLRQKHLNPIASSLPIIPLLLQWHIPFHLGTIDVNPPVTKHILDVALSFASHSESALVAEWLCSLGALPHTIDHYAVIMKRS
jgi:hypothetical protein